MSNAKWVNQNSEKYDGMWVALKDGKLVAHADTTSDLLAQLDKPTLYFITRVVGPQTLGEKRKRFADQQAIRAAATDLIEMFETYEFVALVKNEPVSKFKLTLGNGKDDPDKVAKGDSFVEVISKCK